MDTTVSVGPHEVKTFPCTRVDLPHTVRVLRVQKFISQ